MLGDLNLQAITFNTHSNGTFAPFEPDSSGHTVWDMLGLIFILYQSIVVPYRISFDAPATGAISYFEGFQDIYFCMDICKSQPIYSLFSF